MNYSGLKSKQTSGPRWRDVWDSNLNITHLPSRILEENGGLAFTGGPVYHDYEHVVVSNTCLPASEGSHFKTRRPRRRRFTPWFHFLFWSEALLGFFHILAALKFSCAEKAAMQLCVVLLDCSSAEDEREMTTHSTVDNQPRADRGEGRRGAPTYSVWPAAGWWLRTPCWFSLWGSVSLFTDFIWLSDSPNFNE